MEWGNKPHSFYYREISKKVSKKVLTNGASCGIMYTSGEGNNRRTPPTAEVESVLLKNEFPNKTAAKG
jgi:hypothetical protein